MLDEQGTVTEYWAYAAVDTRSNDDYNLIFAEGAPLPAETAWSINNGQNAIQGLHPLYGEQGGGGEGGVLDPQKAAERANFGLEANESPYRVIDVEGTLNPVDPRTPVSATVRNEVTGETATARLVGFPIDGEGDALLVTVDED